jgi:hypothetical protein
MFVNNVSLGIYGDAVRRPTYRNAKMRTLLESVEEVLGPSAQAPGLRLIDEAGRELTDPVVVLVSNNPYALDHPVARGTRPALDTGQLGIVVVRLPPYADHPLVRSWTVPRLEVTAPTPVHAGIDGEAADLGPPLQFTIRPAALRVRISSHHLGASPSARFSPPGRRQPTTPTR